ncbi:unnamed protein product [Mytilus coruscus]|uniref:Uncharacterized protein n=1 Tax=Mytilus coruscus TaxID=42192 RepID=A0A6J8ANF8_MYTCO|nr:unnamed protein product [Mytilus coruscus]
MENDLSNTNQQSDVHQSTNDANENTHAADDTPVDTDATQQPSHTDDTPTTSQPEPTNVHGDDIDMSNRHKNEGISSWTNVFRDVFECQLTKAEGGNDIPTQCLAGQLVQDNGQWNLIKTKTDCNEGLHWFLCRNDLVSTTIMSSNKTSPTSKLRERQTKTTNMNILVSLKRNIITSYITTESISYTTYMNTSKTPRVTVNRMQTKNQKDLYHNGNNATNIGAVIGGTLGVCFLIAVLSVLIVCKLRIKNISTESNKHDYEDTSQVNFSKKVYEELNNTRNKSTTTTSTQTCDLDESNSTVYDEIN